MYVLYVLECVLYVCTRVCTVCIYIIIMCAMCMLLAVHILPIHVANTFALLICGPKMTVNTVGRVLIARFF